MMLRDMIKTIAGKFWRKAHSRSRKRRGKKGTDKGVRKRTVITQSHSFRRPATCTHSMPIMTQRRCKMWSCPMGESITSRLRNRQLEAMRGPRKSLLSKLRPRLKSTSFSGSIATKLTSRMSTTGDSTHMTSRKLGTSMKSGFR